MTDKPLPKFTCDRYDWKNKRDCGHVQVGGKCQVPSKSPDDISRRIAEITNQTQTHVQQEA